VPLRLDLAEPRVDLGPLTRALAGGACAVIPTDTVYGLVCDAAQPAACARVGALKRRAPGQASTVMFASVDVAAGSLLAPLEPALAGRARALLARGATVLVPNPRELYAHLCGDDPGRIGVRVSAFAPPLAAVLDRAGAILATSANLHGGADPRTLAEVPGAIAAECAVLVDGGPAGAGRPSTVLDLCAPRPVILREGALAAADAFALIA
jgi:tRNA threonylcarbamoyl adenosine modification protein (Sua5/YciO/YrdC/YwlC family)